MFYEEKIINGKLHWRGTPDGKWRLKEKEKVINRKLHQRERILVKAKRDLYTGYDRQMKYLNIKEGTKGEVISSTKCGLIVRFESSEPPPEPLTHGEGCNYRQVFNTIDNDLDFLEDLPEPNKHV